MKDLKPLIRLHQREVDERRRALAAARERLEELRAQRQRFEEQVVAEKRVAGNDPTLAGLTYHGFAKQVILRREQFDRGDAMLQAEVARAEEAVTEAFRELKKFEQVQEQRDLAAKEARRRRETQMFDEVASIRFSRQQGEEEAG